MQAQLPDPAMLARQALAAGGTDTEAGRRDIALFALGYAADRFARMPEDARIEVLRVVAAAALYAEAARVEDALALFLHPFLAGLPDGVTPARLLQAEMQRLAETLPTN